MKRILCVRLPNWPIQRLVVARPELRGGLPPRNASCLILYARDARRGECIVACSRAAHARGIYPGMPLAEATALAQRGADFQPACPPIVEEHDPAADLAALAQLAEACERFSPLAGWETVDGRRDLARPMRSVSFDGPGTWAEIRDGSALGCGPAELFLDVTGIAVLFSGEEQLLRAVEEEFSRRGYRVRPAIADTIGAAWALTFAERIGGCGGVGDATAGASQAQPQPPVAALSSLSVHALRVPLETVDLLAQLGVTTIGQLLELPRDGLASRFGERLLVRLEQALGTAPETIVPHRPPPVFEADWILETPRDDWECLEAIFKQLLERVAQAMAQRQEGAVRLSCRLDCVGAPLKLEIGLYRPTAVPRHLWDLVRMRLEQIALPGPVGRIAVQVVQSAALAERQFDLFGGAVEGTRELGLLVDRLSSRLGMEAVVRPELRHDPLPEKAFSYVPLAGRNSPKSKVQSPKSVRRGSPDTAENPDRRPLVGEVRRPSPNKSKRSNSTTLDFGPWTLDSHFRRPLELLDPPVMLEVLSIVPDGPPIRFRFRGQVHRVARHWGPERIETGWWRGPWVRRDYYRVETEEGQRFWLFRRLEDGAWGMQGVFA